MASYCSYAVIYVFIWKDVIFNLDRQSSLSTCFRWVHANTFSSFSHGKTYVLRMTEITEITTEILLLGKLFL